MMQAHRPDCPCAFCSGPRPVEYQIRQALAAVERGEVEDLGSFSQYKENQMIAFIKYYAKGIVAGIGYVASIATALGLQHEHYVAVVLGVLSTIAVILAPYKKPGAAGNPRPAAR